MDFAPLEIGTKIWNTSWPNTTYLTIEKISQQQEARSLQCQGVNPPFLAEPTIRKIIIHQEIDGTIQENIWVTNQSALLDPNWTLTDPRTTESIPEVKAAATTVSF